MATTNQLAALLANTLNQPNNKELIERCKDYIRNGFSTYIKNSIAKDGIREVLNTTFSIPVYRASLQTWLETNNSTLSIDNYIEDSISILLSENKVLLPIDYKNDAPYTSISYISNTSYINVAYGSAQCLLPLTPSLLVGLREHYGISNNHLIISNYTNKIKSGTNIIIKGILEDPRSVLNKQGLKYDVTDKVIPDDNMDLPIPNSSINNIMYDILRIYFNMYPKHIEINVDNLKDIK